MKRQWLLGILYCMLPILVACNRSGEADPVVEEFFAMDTLIQLTIYGEGADVAAKLAKERILEYEDRFSVTNPESEVTKLNQSGGERVPVSDELAIQLNVAKLLSQRSGGAFDITIYPVMREWGFQGESTKERRYRVPLAEELEKCLEFVNYEHIQIEGNDVRLLNGSTIDLGGIAKGYVGYLIKEELKKMGVKSAILTLGGNVQTIGSKPSGGYWTVGVADPKNPNELLGTITCKETAVVTSGSSQRNFTKDGVAYHHIMDPKTGFPVENGLSSVTVVCEDGMEADGLSTALFVLGKEKAMEYYRRYKGFEAIFVTSKGEIVLTEGLQDEFIRNEGGQVQ